MYTMHISQFGVKAFFLLFFFSTQILARTGPTPALPHRQRMASDNTWRLDCIAAKERAPPALSETLTTGGAPLRSPLALTPTPGR